MSRKYEVKKPSGREYLNAAIDFCNLTHLRCDSLPQRWKDTLLLPLIRCADDIESDVSKANRVYIDPRKMTHEDLRAAYAERINYLNDAVSLFADFDIKFNRLMSQIDIAGSEKKRLKELFYQMLKEERQADPELKKLDVKMVAHADEMEFVSLNGSQHMKLKLTREARDHWLEAEKTALDLIKQRIEKDKKLALGLR